MDNLIIQIDWNKIMSQGRELKKYNHIIDSRKPRDMTLLARNLMNVFLYIRQKQNSNEFQVPIPELRDYLKLTTKDYKNRIEKAIHELSIPIELRDFRYKGKDISYISAALLIEPTIYKDNINYVDIKISDKFVSAIEEKIGYTILDFMKLAECTTKFGHEIAQMLLRYKNLPNKVNDSFVRITKTIEELNDMFGTNYKYASDMLRKLDAGYKDIQDTSLRTEYFYVYDDVERVFIFTWQKEVKEIQSTQCLFPKTRLRELAEWIYDHYENKTGNAVEDKGKFITTCIKKLKVNQWNDAEKAYMGMLKYKYGLIPEMYYDVETNKYIDFKDKK